jgi:signal transduction histidine kinase
MASHDLRAPLSSLNSIVTLINKENIKDKKNLKIISVIEKGLKDLKKKIDLYIDSIDTKENIKIELKTVSFNFTLSQIKENLKISLTNSRAKINSNFSLSPNIKFNKVFLESIFQNIISNSIKYAKKDIPPIINISSYVEGEYTILKFSDNGIGMNMSLVDGQLFQLNKTFHQGHSKECKGVGLYIVKSQIEKLGGSIQVESEINIGTTFLITFKG